MLSIIKVFKEVENELMLVEVKRVITETPSVEFNENYNYLRFDIGEKIVVEKENIKNEHTIKELFNKLSKAVEHNKNLEIFLLKQDLKDGNMTWRNGGETKLLNINIKNEKELQAMTHIERMEMELKELNEKIEKGTVFLEKEIKEPKFTDEIQRVKLACQIEHMTAYANVLLERIKYDKNK